MTGGAARVAVLLGGISREHEISRKSGDAVAQALRSAGHEVLEVVIGTDGAWQLPGAPHPSLPGGHEPAAQALGRLAHGDAERQPVDVVFIGSCTNSRLTDLEQAASVLRGHHIADGVRMLVVPGSQQIKKAAEAIGLDRVFTDAGAEWRESGCSMCLGMNGDTVASGQLSVSTSNRNFEGRQGIGARTVLASPLTAAASAIAGRVADPRPYLSR